MQKILFLLLVIDALYAVNTKYKTIAIVKVTKTALYSQPSLDKKYFKTFYTLGEIFYIDGCDAYDWCKVSGKELYISKASIGIMKIPSQTKKRQTITSKKTPLHQKKLEKKRSIKKSCFRLQHISIDDNELLSYQEKEQTIQPFLEKCINKKVLQSLLNKISQLYIEKGYITTKPYLTQQDISKGNLDISVFKGKIDKIVYKDSNTSDFRISTAFFRQVETVLNLRKLETSLELFNRPASAQATFAIVPSLKPGYSTIVISKHDTRPWRVTFGIIGENQDYEKHPYLNADIEVDNPFNLNDILHLRINGSSVQRYYQSSSGGDLSYSFPLGSYLITSKIFAFQYAQAVLGINDTYRASGTSTGVEAKVSKIIQRSQRNKLTLNASLSYQNNKNYFSNQLIEVSSYPTTVANISLQNSYYGSFGTLSTTLGYHKGTNWFGAKDDASVLNTKEKLQFSKFTFDATLSSVPYNNLQLTSTLFFQYSKDLLYDSNKIRIGSYYTVRGYDASYYGNIGYYFQNDLSKNYQINFNRYFFATLAPFIGFDHGAIKCQENTQLTCGSLNGAAIGLRSYAKNLDTELTLSHALSVIQNHKKTTLFRYSLILKY